MTEITMTREGDEWLVLAWDKRNDEMTADSLSGGLSPEEAADVLRERYPGGIVLPSS